MKRSIKIDPDYYMDKLYASWLGKVIGVRFGAPVENWSQDRIESVFGELGVGYLKPITYFTSDDDTNGPAFFIRTLLDAEDDYPDITDFGETWLNYVGDERGFFWWGGYGISTEHTAYVNLRDGKKAPISGSETLNGTFLSEQIGGQIFSDIWGMVAPGQLDVALDLATKASQVSHDGEAVLGSQFIAGCVSLAFVEEDIQVIVKKVLEKLPKESLYYEIGISVLNFYEKEPNDWKKCLAFIQEKYGYQHFEGVCHVIPNAGVVIMALLYGEGDFDRSVIIGNASGWDTDCNVGNVGAILGALSGVNQLNTAWLDPLNDFLCCSSAIGSENITDISKTALLVAKGAKRIGTMDFKGSNWEEIIDNHDYLAHFQFPKSTHGFEAETIRTGNRESVLENVKLSEASRGLKMITAPLVGGEKYGIVKKTYFYPEDFEEYRLQPSFSPLVYPGQKLTAWVHGSLDTNEEHIARIGVKTNSGSWLYGESVSLNGEKEVRLTFTIPYLENTIIEKVGVIFEGTQNELGIGKYYLESFSWDNQMAYKTEFGQSQYESWNSLENDISQFSKYRGLWYLENGLLCGSHAELPAEIYTGLLNWKDYTLTTTIVPLFGDYHRIYFRMGGERNSYYVELCEGNLIRLVKRRKGRETILEKVARKYELGEEVTLEICVEKNRIIISENNQLLIDFVDEHRPNLTGLVGFGNQKFSKTGIRCFDIYSKNDSVKS